jgi:hypothetical protein
MSPGGVTEGPMRKVRGAPVVWNVSVDDPRRQRETKPVDFVAFFAMGFPVLVLPGIGLPVNEVAPLMVCLLAANRVSTSRERIPFWFSGGLVAVLTMLAVTSYLHDLTPSRRLLHVLLYLVLATLLASGRIHIPSAARGLAVGLCTSITMSIAGFGPDNYAGRLTGYLGDPNAGGYVVAVLGLVALGLGPRGRLRWLLIFLALAAVVLTYSRTTLLAVAFAVVWLLIGRRVSVWAGALLVGAMVYVVGHIPPQLTLFGPFSDRGGSDLLRQRIIAQEHVDISHSPIIGNGAGTATVNLQGDVFFYHSSYLALQAEGGVVCLVLLVGVIVLTFLSIARMPRDMRNGWLEASLIALMVCAVNVGEILLELPSAIAIGMAMWHRLNATHPVDAHDDAAAPAAPDRLSHPEAGHRARRGS